MSVTPSSAIVGIFRDHTTAEQTMDALYNAGFTHEQVRYSSPGSSGGFFEDLKNLFTGPSTANDNVATDLTDMGLSEEEANYYANEHSQGNIILAVKAPGRTQEAQTIMHQYGSLNAPARNNPVQDTTPYTQQALGYTEYATSSSDVTTPTSQAQSYENDPYHPQAQVIAPQDTIAPHEVQSTEAHDAHDAYVGTDVSRPRPYSQQDTQPFAIHEQPHDTQQESAPTGVEQQNNQSSLAAHDTQPTAHDDTTEPQAVHIPEIQDIHSSVAANYISAEHVDDIQDTHPVATNYSSAEHVTDIQPTAAEHITDIQDVPPITEEHVTDAQDAHPIAEEHVVDAQDTHPTATDTSTEEPVSHVQDVQMVTPDATVQPQAVTDTSTTEPNETHIPEEPQVTSFALSDTTREAQATSAPSDDVLPMWTNDPTEPLTDTTSSATTPETTSTTTPEMTATTGQTVVSGIEHMDELQQLQAQVDALHQQVQDAKAQLQAAKEREAQIKLTKEREQQLQSTRQRIQELQAELAATHAELQDTHARIGQYS